VVYHSATIVKPMTIPIITVTMNVDASNAVEIIAPIGTAQRTELVQLNASFVLRYTRPTLKDAMFINPLPKNALKCSQGSCQSQMSSRLVTPDVKDTVGLTQKQLWATQII